MITETIETDTMIPAARMIVDTEYGVILHIQHARYVQDDEYVGKRKDHRAKFEFIKLYKANVDDVNKLVREQHITPAEYAFFMFCVERIGYETNFVVDNRGIPLSITSLAKIYGIEQPQASKWIASLVNKGLIAAVKEGRSVYVL